MGLSKRLWPLPGQRPPHFLMILLPSIMTHGLFDYALSALSWISRWVSYEQVVDEKTGGLITFALYSLCCCASIGPVLFLVYETRCCFRPNYWEHPCATPQPLVGTPAMISNAP